MSDFSPGSFNIEEGLAFKNPQMHDLLNFFGLIQHDAKGMHWDIDEKVSKKLERLYIWAAYKSKSSDYEEIKNKLYDLQRNVGVNWTGRLLVDKLWQHTMFDSKFNSQLDKFVDHVQTQVKNQPEEIRREVVTKASPAKATPVKDTGYKPEAYKNTMGIGTTKIKPAESQFI